MSPDCRCPRQGDLWKCRARPALVRTADGEACELGRQIRETGSDYSPGIVVPKEVAA